MTSNVSTGLMVEPPKRRASVASATMWRLSLAVALVVAAAQFWFIATLGSDLPFDDQWDVEGAWMYPRTVDGTFRLADVFMPHNEHRIVWTHFLNLALFRMNGQWDPILQLMVIVFLRAVVAGCLMGLLASTAGRTIQATLFSVITLLFLPHLSWYNVLFGFQTQVYFCLGFSVVAMWLLTAPQLCARAWFWGVGAGIVAQLGMGAGAFIVSALIGLVMLKVSQRPQVWGGSSRLLAGALLLGALGVLLRQDVPTHDVLRAKTVLGFLRTLGLGLAWPYPENPLIAFVANAPFVVWLTRKVVTREPASHTDYFAFALALFSVSAAAAQAVFRGGGPDFAYSVPSRYVEFLVPLVVVNFYYVGALLSGLKKSRSKLYHLGAMAWALVVFAGWLGTSIATWQRVIELRIANLGLSTELVRSFQATGDPEVFAGYRRTFVPHPSPGSSIGRVLTEPRLKGRLPPSLQPEDPVAMWSRGARWMLQYHAGIGSLALVAAALLLLTHSRQRKFIVRQGG